ncbi:MAG: pyridoxamine 5'-phosphate oxidase family protein [Methanomicrobiales archaeon]|nr:pyridoxamine 5'-phosphate oxidase family protein [Methanomicrobiales archaeon]
MVKLTEEMKAVFSKLKIFPVATSSKGGVPNVVPIANVQLLGDDTLWIGDNYMVKSAANVRENPHCALYIYDPDVKRCFQIKGKVEVKTSGPEYDKMRTMIKAKNEKYPAKALWVVKITDVFECTPGATAGKKVL